MLPIIDPMLAMPSRSVAATADEAVKVLASNGLWYFDMKWDGVRTVAYITGGQVSLRSRDGNITTHRYPEVIEALEREFADQDVILDGEIIVFGPDGKPSWPMSHRRDAQNTDRGARALMASMPATYMVFDLLYVNGHDMRPTPFVDRHRALLDTFEDRQSPALRVTAASMEGQAMWDFVNANSLEGLVAKKLSSTYSAGRSHYWVKLKPVRSLSALVTGHRPGDGQGALEIALIDTDHTLRSIGHVGSGLTLRHVKQLEERARAGQAVTIAEIQYMEVSPEGMLRQPVFKGFREDVDLTDCNISQLEG